METIKFYYQASPSTAVESAECAISEWYCKPAILSCLALKAGCLFVTCSKFGCRQFLPKFSKFYPIHNYLFLDYKENLPWLILEFSNWSKPESWSDDRFYKCLFGYE